MTVPDLEIWSNKGKRSWWSPLVRERVPFIPEDPLVPQVWHFCDVIQGKAAPIVSGREGLNTLKVIGAVEEAARTGATVQLRELK